MKIKTNSLKPGVPKSTDESTIFNIYKVFSTDDQLDEFSKEFADGISWSEAKNKLFDLLNEILTPHRIEYERIINEKKEIESILNEGAIKALETSSPLLNRVREAVGIRSFNS